MLAPLSRTILLPLLVVVSSCVNPPQALPSENPDNVYSLAAAAAIAAQAEELLQSDAPRETLLDEAQMAAYDIEYPEVLSGLEISEVQGGLKISTMFSSVFPVDTDADPDTFGVAYVCLDGDKVATAEQPCRD